MSATTQTGSRVQVIAEPGRRVAGRYEHGGETITVLVATPWAGMLGTVVGHDSTSGRRKCVVVLDAGRTLHIAPSALAAREG